MKHARNETVSLFWETGEDASLLLIEAAGAVAALEETGGYARVLLEPTTDPDTGKFEYALTVYAHG
jgi:hypothetical protein